MYHELPDESGFYKPLQVTGIHQNDGVCFGHSVIECPWIDPEEFEEAIEPIPLTQELLYKNTYDEASNTYHVYNTVGYVQYCITDRFVIKCYTDGEKEVFKYEGLVLEYVHDLQHLLEIARIDKEIIL